MKASALYTLLLSALLASSCQTDDDTKPQVSGVAGYWTVTKLECYCPANAPVPNEALELDAAGNATRYLNGQVVQTGTYELSTGAAACETNAPVITFSWTSLTPGATYTLSGDVLVIDYGLCFDAPRYTYSRTNSR
ncbi:hypothetical protein [Hymenobacter koreensis]|uniref:Lipocalin-like domain-containing protein n=1 Tax=Hymenobacter koreensis TaxID=1084523 RepID=A0ABP8IU64_9BACT